MYPVKITSLTAIEDLRKGDSLLASHRPEIEVRDQVFAEFDVRYAGIDILRCLLIETGDGNVRMQTPRDKDGKVTVAIDCELHSDLATLAHSVWRALKSASAP